MKQIDRVLAQLKKEGKVSRNNYLDLPYGDKITRLGSIINRLRTRGYTIMGYEEGHDFIYRLDLLNDGTVPVRVEYQKVMKDGQHVMLRIEVPLSIAPKQAKMPLETAKPTQS